MKFCIPSKTFYSYASAVGKVINSKNAIAVLNNFHMTLEGDTLSIKGSDLENSLTAHVPVTNAEGSGSFCVDAKRLIELLKEIPDQGVTFDMDRDYRVVVTYSAGKCEFVAIDGAEYPAENNDDDADQDVTVSFSAPSSVVVKGIENTLFAASNDDFRPTMMGVFFDIAPDSMTFVATDTRKLVKYSNTNCTPGITTSFIMPAKPAAILRSVFNSQDDLQFETNRKSATITNGSFTFNCRFLQGKFPDYNRVIPRNNSLVVTVDRLTLLNAVRRVGLFVTSEFGLEKFKITTDSIELKAEDSNLLTSGNEKLPCSYSGPQIIIGFSSPFLIEMLSTMSSTDVTISLSDPGRPGLFQPAEQPEGTELLMILMPMTVGSY